MLSNCVPLLFFFAGLLWAEFISPTIESLIQLFLVWLETKRAKLSISIAASQVEIQKAGMPEERASRQIGFIIDTEEEDYYEEDSEEDDI